MKTTKNGYRITKNGNVIKSFEEDSILKTKYEGNLIKKDSVYYFLNRIQNKIYVYLP